MPERSAGMPPTWPRPAQAGIWGHGAAWHRPEADALGPGTHSDAALEIPMSVGVVRGIAFRGRSGDSMREAAAQLLLAGRGLEGEQERSNKRRSVTLLSLESWRDVCTELQADLPWYSRRANFLIEGLDLAEAIGHGLEIGPARIWIHGETKPCGLMDKTHLGLRETLKPFGRGGVYGEVMVGGTVCLGDRAALILAPWWCPPVTPQESKSCSPG